MDSPQNFIDCRDGRVSVCEKKLKGVSLYFEREIGRGVGREEVILSENSYKKKSVELALRIVFSGPFAGSGEFLCEKEVLLEALSFLDKYLFRRENVVRGFLQGSTKDLQAVRLFFQLNRTIYSKEISARASERIEETLFRDLDSISKTIHSLEMRISRLEEKTESFEDSQAEDEDCCSLSCNKCREGRNLWGSRQ